MVSREDMHKPVRSAGCLWLMTKVLVAFLIIVIFCLGLFAGILMSAVASTLT